MGFKQLTFVVVTLILTTPSYGKQLWSDNSFALWRGTDFKLGDKNRTVLTYEHVSGHSWGDIFMFTDRVESDNGDKETYWEISPRLSIGKMFDVKPKGGIINDILITTTTEMATSATNYLYGPAIDLDIPGFAVFQLNFYRRNNESQKNNWQLTPVWMVPFSVGSMELSYEGFADWSSGTEEGHAVLNFTSELKLDIGAFWGESKTLYAGIKYIFIENKFGIEDDVNNDTNERNLTASIEVHF